MTPSRPSNADGPARLVLVGVGGFGLVHARHIAQLQAAGEVELVAAVDPVRDAPPDVIAQTPLYADLALDAVARAAEPVRIDPRAIDWRGEGAERRPVLQHLAAVDDSPDQDAVATGVHPVRTRAGVVVSATHPADHDWHTGLGMAVPDVNGTNFWGGGSYRPGAGYQLLDDHGLVVGAAVQEQPDGFRQRLTWVGRDGRTELVEHRSVRWAAAGPTAWGLELVTSLTGEDEVRIGSPGSKGRVGGGYGGFFWRLPACRDVDVFTATARGEQAVHGSVQPWLAWSADFLAGPGASGAATIVLSSDTAVENDEPWFVRARDYPGLGSALAWDRPLVLGAGEALERRFQVLVADGRLDRAEVAALVAGVRAG